MDVNFNGKGNEPVRSAQWEEGLLTVRTVKVRNRS